MRRPRPLARLIPLALAALAGQAAAAPMVLPRSAVWDEGAFRIVAALPPAPAPAAGYALVLALDAGWTFGTLRDMAIRAAQGPGGERPVIVAGIGYPTADLVDREARGRDMVGEGRPALLAAIVAAVDRIAAQHPVDRTRILLVGHSYGGAFVLHACGARPSLASHWVAVSPSLWAVPDLDVSHCPRDRTAIIVGGLERPQAEDAPDRAARAASRDMIGRAGAAAASIGAAFAIIPGKTHGTVLPGALSDATAFLQSDALSGPAPYNR